MKTQNADLAYSVISSEKMRNLEQDAIKSGAVTGLALLERAGQGVVQAVFAQWPQLKEKSGRACVLCGPGNNGGDGFVIARLLDELGWQVDAVLLGNGDKLPKDARHNYERWIKQHTVLPLAQAEGVLIHSDLVVDALFGIGLSRQLDDSLCHLFLKVPTTARRIAVDVPSGIMADSTEDYDQEGVFPAQLAVTFHAQKPVHAILAKAGVTIAVTDIGL